MKVIYIINFYLTLLSVGCSFKPTKIYEFGNFKSILVNKISKYNQDNIYFFKSRDGTFDLSIDRKEKILLREGYGSFQPMHNMNLSNQTKQVMENLFSDFKNYGLIGFEFVEEYDIILIYFKLLYVDKSTIPKYDLVKCSEKEGKEYIGVLVVSKNIKNYICSKQFQYHNPIKVDNDIYFYKTCFNTQW